MNGKEAKLAWANGEEVEYSGKHFDWVDINGGNTLAVFDDINFKFRLKPKTININGVDSPKPKVARYKDDGLSMELVFESNEEMKTFLNLVLNKGL